MPTTLHTRTIRRLVRHLVRGLAGLALGLVFLLTANCGGGGADTPEDVFASVQQATAKADWRAFWGLYTREERQRQTDGWASFKEFLRTNPAENNRTHCERTFGVSPETFYGLEPFAIFELTMRDAAGRMDGARIENVEAAAEVPGRARIWWLDRHEERHSMLVQEIDGTWRLVKAIE